MRRHVNIPIFIPHLGCPNRCIFCNQRSISGQTGFDIGGVRQKIEQVLSTVTPDTTAEIAFFGGSFTGIERKLILALLQIAAEYRDAGRISAIRLSTRPDYISREILDILKSYGVTTIELGIQSMDDTVLRLCKRGHDAACTRQACRLIVASGFELVGQMMVGLPGSDGEAETACARFICDSGAAAARVYPTVVFYGTELYDMARAGRYRPLSLEEAVARTKDVLAVFARRDLPCIRVGLCADETFFSEGKVYAGPSHSAVGEMAMSALFFDILCQKIEALGQDPAGCILKVYGPRGCTSKIIGHKGINRQRLAEKYRIKRLAVLEKEDFFGYNIKIELLKTGGNDPCI